MKKLKQYRWLLFLVPWLLGTYGYYQVYGNLPSSFYSAVRLYSIEMDIDESQVNLCLQIARWLALLASASAVALIFQRISTGFMLRHRLRKPDTIVVHGDGARAATVIKTMGKNAIPMSEKVCFRAQKHVLAFDADDAALTYLLENQQQLQAQPPKEIYFSSFDYEASDYADLGLIVSNNAVNCARLYWQKYWFEGDQKIAIIGFDSYGQRLLEQGLLVNVPAGRKPAEYHIFGGDSEAYLNWHPQFGQMVAIDHSEEDRDSVFFHPEIEKAGSVALEGMDRVIIAMNQPDANCICLNRLLSAGIMCPCHILCDRELLSQVQYIPRQRTGGSEAEVVSFGDADQLYTCEVIMHGELTAQARAAHQRYVSNSEAQNIRNKYAHCAGCTKSGLCGDCKAAPDTWDDLSPFEKASNIAAADHLPIKRRLLAQAAQEPLTQQTKTALCKVEHIRWSRFLYLNNWRYAPARNDAHRLHDCLLPFDSLPPQVQERNWWAYEPLVSAEEKEAQ